MAEESGSPSPSSKEMIAPNRGWLISLGLFSWLVGLMAIWFPQAMTLAITQVLGILCVVSGVFALGAVFFGKAHPHRMITCILAIVRIAVGMALIMLIQGAVALTMLLTVLLFAEGIFCVIGAFRVRGHAGWLWMLLNGLVALLLGGMIYAHFPGDAAWILGLLYGINSIFYGTSLLMLGFSAPKTD